MSYAPGLLGRVAFRRSGYVGPKIQLDVVDDIKRAGRVAFLRESRIDQKKGKAYDAQLQMPRRYGDGDQDGPTGSPQSLPAGGTGGRQSFTGVGSKPVLLVGITKRRVTMPTMYNGL